MDAAVPTDATLNWGAHVVLLAPALYLARGSPDLLGAMLAGVLGYAVYRLLTRACADTDPELFDLLVLVPLLLLGRKAPQLVSLVAALVALYFTAKMAMAYANARRCRR